MDKIIEHLREFLILVFFHNMINIRKLQLSKLDYLISITSTEIVNKNENILNE